MKELRVQGLRDKRDFQDEDFLKFFNVVQKEAKKQRAVFFLECEEGNEGTVDNIKCMNFTGWLIPNEFAKTFNDLFLSYSDAVDDDEWDKFCVAEEWSKNREGELTINFRDLFPYIEMCRKDNFK